MVSHSGLIATARELAGVVDGPPPSQTNLRRSVSTTYYALFHCLAENCAEMLVGEVGSDRSEPAWKQAYRALQHGTAKQRIQQNLIVRFPVEIQDFAKPFVAMQQKRELADYDPDEIFAQSEVIRDINASEDAITQFLQSLERDRRAFAVYVLLNLRNS